MCTGAESPALARRLDQTVVLDVLQSSPIDIRVGLARQGFAQRLQTVAPERIESITNLSRKVDQLLASISYGLLH